MPVTHTYLLPFVDFGDGDLAVERGGGLAPIKDRIEFQLNGKWTLQRLIDWDEAFVSVPEAVARKAAVGESSENLKFSTTAALEITADALDQHVTSRDADDICWLLALPLGQTVSWTACIIAQPGQQAQWQKRDVRRPAAFGKRAPARNDGNGRLKHFLETGYSNYIKDRDWWALSIDWWVQMHESPNTHIVGLLASILLERTSEFHLHGIKWRDQIDVGVDAYLKKHGEALAHDLDELFKAKVTGKWEPTEALS